MQRVCHLSLTVVLAMLVCTISTALADPNVSLVTYDDWVNAVNSGTVHPGTAWDEGLESSYPGQSGDFRVSTITPADAYTTPLPLSVPGLLMEWGAAEEAGDLIGAWVYEYAEPSDLSGSIISFGVLPPTGVNSVYLGLTDINGSVRSYVWDVGPTGTLQPDQLSTLTIDLSQEAQPAGMTSLDGDFVYEAVKWFTLVEKGWTWSQGPYRVNKWVLVRVTPVPEPSALLALGSGLVGLIGLGLRRRRT